MNPFLPNATPSMDLSGRTPIYRLSQGEQPWPQIPTPTPSNPYVSPYHAPPQHSPPQSQPQHRQQSPQQSPSIPQTQNEPSPESPAQEEAVATPPSGKRRGRKLLEEQVLVLFNCCLERKELYMGQDRTRFWISVASKLKQLTHRSFAWQSCRRIVTDRTLERRVQRREIDVGRRVELEPSELAGAIDRWIAMEDQMEQRITAALNPKRTVGQAQGPEGDTTIEARNKRPKQPTVKETLAESLVKLSESLTREDNDNGNITATEVQNLRQGMDEIRRGMDDMRRELSAMRVDMNRKFELAISLLAELKDQDAE